MRTAVVAALLLGSALAALAQEPPKATLEAVETSNKYSKKHEAEGKHEYKIIQGVDGRNGKDGKDGENGADGRPGPQGAQGRPGKDGKDGMDGRDAWVAVAWRAGTAGKVNITAGERVKHVINQISSIAKCAEGEKATGCSCDTGMSSSNGAGFQAPKHLDYAQHDGSWTSRVNYITLVENALSGAKDVKDTCTCTGLYVATVRAKKPIKHVEEEEEEEEEEGDETEYAKLMGGKDAHAAYADDWTKKAPKWQAFEITATATCQSTKLVPRPHYKDAYDEEGEEKYPKKSEKEYPKKSDKDEDKDDSSYGDWKKGDWKTSDKY